MRALILNVIFDTHIYRALSATQAADLSDQESELGVRPLVNYWTAIELATHLADETDAHYRIARRALVSMWRHTTEATSAAEVPLLADTEAQLAHSFFKVDVAARAEDTTLTITALRSMTRSDSDPLPPELAPLLNHIRDHVNQREARFADDMLAIVRHLDPQSTGWQPFVNDPDRRRAALAIMKHPQLLEALARTRLFSIAHQFGVSVPHANLRSMTAALVKYFPTPLYFFRNLLIGLVESGTTFSYSKHANSIWDLQLAFAVSPEATVDRKPMVLVTNERRIHRAAREAGHASFVLDMTTYRVAIASGSIVDLAARLPSPERPGT